MSLAEPLIEAGAATQTDEKRKAAAAKRKLLLGAALCTTFMLVEVIGVPACRWLVARCTGWIDA